MLETSEERVKLLKSGICTRRIEQLYIMKNNYKIVNIPEHFEVIEIRQEDEVKGFFHELTTEYVNA